MHQRENRICVDIDNVTCQTDRVMRELIRRHTKGRVCLSYADIQHFDYEKCSDVNGLGINLAEWKSIHNESFSVPSVIESLEPTIHAPLYLAQLAQAGFKVNFVTSRKEWVRVPTRNWLAKHFPDLDFDLDFAPHRQKHMLPQRFLAAIEDDLDQALLFLGIERKCATEAETFSVVTEPVVEHSFVLAHPWNRFAPSAEIQIAKSRLVRLETLEDIIEHILSF
jgi:hypothetical protein